MIKDVPRFFIQWAVVLFAGLIALPAQAQEVSQTDSLKRLYDLTDPGSKARNSIAYEIAYQYGQISLNDSANAWLIRIEQDINRHQQPGNYFVASVYNLKSGTLYDMNRFDSSRIYTLKLEAVLNAANTSLSYEERSYVYNMLKIRYQLDGNYHKALYYATLVDEHSKGAAALDLLKNTLAIHEIYMHLDDKAHTLQYAKRAIEQAKHLDKKDDDWKSTAYIQVGQYYRITGNYPLALRLLDTALQLMPVNSLDLSNNYLTGNIYLEKATCLHELKDYPASITMLDSAQRYARITDAGLLYLAIAQLKATLYRKWSNADSCKKYVAQMLALAAQYPNAETDMEVYMEAARSYAFLNDYKSALAVQEKYLNLRDTLFNQKKQQDINLLTVEYETEKKEKQIAEQTLAINTKRLENLELEKSLRLNALRYEYEKKQKAARSEEEKKQLRYEAGLRQQQIEHEAAFRRQQIENESAMAKARLTNLALQKDKQIADQQTVLNQRRLLNMGFASLAVLLLIAGGFGYARYRTRRRNEMLLSGKNQRIETLMQELQHRVKNNMQMISSLLSLQSNAIADAGARDAVLQGQHRIEAMSLIHQKLYLEETLNGINMQEYLEELVQGLVKSYTGNATNVKLQTDIDPVFVPVDTAVPLGLITNELVTNALKYGLTAAAPALQVSLNNNNGLLHLAVQDNGMGIQPGNARTGNLGMKLITALAKQLDATVTIRSEGGTIAAIQQQRL